jgi:hypothetical protein
MKFVQKFHLFGLLSKKNMLGVRTLCILLLLLLPCVIHAQNDTDGDGVSDIEDLDTDNDGILDLEECPISLIDWTSVGTIAPGSSGTIPFALANGSIVTVIVTNDPTSGSSIEPVRISSSRGAIDLIGTDSGNRGLRPTSFGSSPIILTYTFSQPVDVQFTDGELLGTNEPPITVSSNGAGFTLEKQRGDTANGIIVNGLGTNTITYNNQSSTSPSVKLLRSNNVTSLTVSFNQLNSGNSQGKTGVSIGIVDDPAHDTDGDGLMDCHDLDSDNDGISDNVEAQTTTGYIVPNADTTNDYSTNKGVNSAYLGGLTPINTDGVDDVDYIDNDSDNDGILDVLENGVHNVVIGTDTDGDGLDDNFDVVNTLSTGVFDVNDYISNPATDLPDRDSDVNSGGDVDYRDLALDTDGDGVLDLTDLDDDNDGILDANECISEQGINFSYITPQRSEINSTQHGVLAGTILSTDVAITGFGGHRLFEASVGDGSIVMRERPVSIGQGARLTFSSPVDDLRLTFTSLGFSHLGNFTVTYGDGSQITNVMPIIEQTPLPNSNDTNPIHLDMSGRFIRDTNNSSAQSSGTITFPDNDNIRSVTFQHVGNFPGTTNRINLSLSATIFSDSDNDGIIDCKDLDSDNDGILDNVEAQTTTGYIAPSGVGTGITDADNDGIDDNYAGGLTPVNTDGLDEADYLDSDSDNDGMPDIEENGDSDNTTAGTDTDGDGLDDNFDTVVGFDVNDNINNPSTDLPDTDNDLNTGSDVDYRDDRLNYIYMRHGKFFRNGREQKMQF